jgi:hypothetical protein
VEGGSLRGTPWKEGRKKKKGRKDGRTEGFKEGGIKSKE